MAKWVKIGPIDGLSEGGHVCLTAEDSGVIVCKLDGELFAAANVCPHAHMPIGEGELRGSVLTCPFHGYAFDVKTGRNVDFADDLPLCTFPIRTTEDGRVEVDIEKAP